MGASSKNWWGSAIVVPLALLSGLLLAAEPAAPIVALAVTPDGSQILAGSQAGVQIVSLSGLKPAGRIATKLEQVHELAFSPRGELLAIAGGSPGDSGAVEIWEWPAARLRSTLALGNDLAYDASWNAAGSRLAFAGADKAVRILDADGRRSLPITLRPHSAAVLTTLWLPADDLVLSAGVDQTIRLLNPNSGETIRSFENHRGAVRDLTLRTGQHDGPVVVASAAADRTVRFWWPKENRLVRFATLSVAPTAISWTIDGSHVLAACEDGRLRAVDPDTIAVTELPGEIDGWAYAAAITPDGKSAVLGGERGQLRLIDLGAINR
jgi:WD40 repeat protein